MPLRKGESFLQGSARVKRQLASAAAVAPFVPKLVVPTQTPRVPPVPKVVRDWEKKTPADKLQSAGFLGAVQNDRAVTRYRFEREAARMAPAISKVARLEARDPGIAKRDRARAELVRLEKLPRSKQRGDYWDKLGKARAAAGSGRHGLVRDIEIGVYRGSKPLREYLADRAFQTQGGTAGLSLPTPRIVSDALEVGAKMVLGLPVGAAAMARHPLRVPGQIKDIASDVVQPIGLAMASTSSSKARQKLWEDFTRESLTAMEKQYGPQTTWSESVHQSYNQGLIAVLQGLAVVAPAFKLGSIALNVAPRLALTEEGLGLVSGKGLRQAIRESSTPAEPRVVRLRGGEEAMGQPVEIRHARSPLIRATVQRPYDVLSRRIGEETPIFGKLSEAQRAARVTRRSLKRDVRRVQADAANALAAAGRESDAESLRAVYMRGKPEGVSEDAWLEAQLADVNEMLAGRGLIRPQRESPKLKQLRRRVAVLQRKYDRTKTDVEQRAVERKLEGLSGEQLAVAKGEPVGPVVDSPARSQMSAVFTEALGPEQGGVAMQVADQLARGAEPDNPSAWYDRILTQYAEDPEATGLDLASALLQEAGPRRSLSGAHAAITPQLVENFTHYQSRVGLADEEGGASAAEGIIKRYDHDRQVAWVDLVDDQGYETGEQVVTTYDQLRDPHGEAVPEDAPVFYSAAQKVVHEKLPAKVNPDQLISLLEKNQIKKAELEWTGLADWAAAKKDSGIKSVTKEEVIRYLADPLNAFDLNETLWEQGAHPHGTRWDPDNYTGVTLTDVPGEYKELMVQLPGEQVYRSSGHMPNIDNPLVQLRFHEVNRQGYNEILIDEMQSDWAAAARDVNYETKGPDSEARLEKLRADRGKLHLDYIERVMETLQIPYDDIPGGTTDMNGARHYLQELRQKLDSDFRRESVIGMGVIEGDEKAALWQAWMATPERKAIERLMRHTNAVTDRVQRLNALERNLINAPADMPYKKTWELLGLKRMVAYAVHNGFDAISWPQGIVPAVRYQKVEVEHLIEPEYADPKDHPQYPDESDYTRSYTYGEHEFDQTDVAENDPAQERLFGAFDPEYGYDTMSPGSAPMSTTTPHRMTAEELGLEPETQHNEFTLGGATLSVDDLIYMDEGPFANQFLRVARVNEDGTYDVAPSRIQSVEFRGNADDGGWQEYEVTVTENGRQAYGSGTTAADALRSANFDDLADSEWFDDLETKLDQGWESELDDYLYQEAVDDFMERWDDGEIEGSREYAEGSLASAQDIAEIDYSHYKGNAYRYDTIFPSAARKEWKKYGVEVQKSGVDGSFTVEGHGRVSTEGTIPTWRMEIPEALANDVRQGQSFFQAVYPLTGSTTPIVKGAVELMGNRRFRMSLFGQADITTAIHELGHIALHDLDANDLTTIERELAGGRALKDWTRHDHERFARAWERFFQEGYASTTSLRGAFQKIKDWMRAVYNGYKATGDPLSPEVQRVFEKRLGKVGLDEADRLAHPDPALTRWGVQLSQAKNELEAYEARAEIARQKGTDEALRAEMETKIGQRDAAEQAGDRDRFDSLTTEIRSIEKELNDRDALNAMRVERRQKLLAARAGELHKALQKPDSRRYEGAQAAADFFQDEREQILRDVFGDKYDDIFAGRRQQMSSWLAARGVLPEADVGEGAGFLPFRRRGGAGAAIKQAASPVTRRFGRSRTNDLNLHARNQMTLWQQGDYQASIHVLHEQYIRALSFKYQHDLRRLMHEIGEPVDVSGPKEGWYLIDPDASPLPREWKGENAEEIDAAVQAVLDGLAADDAQLSLQLQHFAENWLHTDPSRARRPDGGYGNVRQVHPKIVHQLMLPYTGNQLWNPVVRGAAVANTLARVSLIYTAPGYIPSNILANVTLLLAERGLMSVWDLYEGARMTSKDSRLAARARVWMGREYEHAGLGRRVRAEMGETFTTSKLRADTGEVLALPRKLEGKLASGLSLFADDWVRAAAWSGVARRNGYRGGEAQMRLLDGKTEQTRRDRERIAEQATRAMIDFDRLSPWEQRYLRPLVFVWPFIRGATSWPLDYVKEHPFRAGAIVALTHGYGEQAREELGPTPDYYNSLVPTDLAKGEVANLASVSPLGPFSDVTATLSENLGSLVTGEKVGAFRNLASFLAPQNDLLLQIIRGQGEFGEAASLRDIVTKAGPEFVPFLSLYLDTLDETKPATQLDQGFKATLSRRIFRFTPQRMNLALLNQQAKERGEAKTVTQKMSEARVTARSAWNQLMPGDHMPRAIEDSIKAYYIVQGNRALLKDEIKKHQRESWQPTRRDPKLTPLQEAAIVYDVLAAQHPDVIDGVPDPRAIFDQYGEAGVDRYRRKIEGVLFKGKRTADEARRKAKQMRKAGIR